MLALSYGLVPTIIVHWTHHVLDHSTYYLNHRNVTAKSQLRITSSLAKEWQTELCCGRANASCCTSNCWMSKYSRLPRSSLFQHCLGRRSDVTRDKLPKASEEELSEARVLSWKQVVCEWVKWFQHNGIYSTFWGNWRPLVGWRESPNQRAGMSATSQSVEYIRCHVLGSRFCQTELLNERKCPEMRWMYDNVTVIDWDDWLRSQE